MDSPVPEHHPQFQLHIEPPPSPPSPLFHALPSLPNFRDIGGWPIASPSPSSPSQPKHVRTNIIFRSSAPTSITPTDISALYALNIRTIYDLRSAPQIAASGGVKEIEGIRRVWIPVFVGEEATEEKIRERYGNYGGEGVKGIVEAYMEILEKGAEGFARLLRDLLASVTPHLPLPDTPLPHFSSDLSATTATIPSPPPAILIHCTTGNNRTAPFISLLLLFLHVPPSFIATEYALSELGLAATRHINVERLLKKGAFAEHGVEEARKRCERMVGARRESMEGLLEEATRRWGKGAAGYTRGMMGLTDGELRALTQYLTVNGEGELEIP